MTFTQKDNGTEENIYIRSMQRRPLLSLTLKAETLKEKWKNVTAKILMLKIS